MQKTTLQRSKAIKAHRDQLRMDANTLIAVKASMIEAHTTIAYTAWDPKSQDIMSDISSMILTLRHECQKAINQIEDMRNAC